MMIFSIFDITKIKLTSFHWKKATKKSPQRKQIILFDFNMSDNASLSQQPTLNMDSNDNHVDPLDGNSTQGAAANTGGTPLSEACLQTEQSNEDSDVDGQLKSTSILLPTTTSATVFNVPLSEACIQTMNLSSRGSTQMSADYKALQEVCIFFCLM